MSIHTYIHTYKSLNNELESVCREKSDAFSVETDQAMFSAGAAEE